MESQSEARIVVRVEDVGGTPLTQLLVYQVAREALANAIRHAEASFIGVDLLDGGDCIRLVISDDGKGFDASSVDRHSHFGLQLMRERVELAGGDFLLESGSGVGTTVVVKVPVENGRGRRHKD